MILEKAKLVLKIFFYISYIFLILWAFDFTKYKIISFFWNFIGIPYEFQDKKYTVFLPIQLYNPQSTIKPYKENLIEKPKYPIIEFHGHLFNEKEKDILENLKKNNIKLFINLSLLTTTIEEYKNLENKYSTLKDKMLIFPGLNWKRLEEDNSINGIKKMAQDLEEIAKEKKIKGIKIWKDFGLMRKKPDQTLWKLDDKEFDLIWDICSKYKLIVAIHTADPEPFFSPVDEKNERFIELSNRPEWSFYGAYYPTFEELLQQRENLFSRRKDLTFIALHFGELGNNLKKAEELLTKYSNVYLDIAQRIDELGRQPKSAKEFIIKFQDRILYGTDGPPNYEKSKIYWRFLETEDEYFDYKPPNKPYKGLWKIYGLGLPDEVLKKIYYLNAEKLLNFQK